MRFSPGNYQESNSLAATSRCSRCDSGGRKTNGNGTPWTNWMCFCIVTWLLYSRNPSESIRDNIASVLQVHLLDRHPDASQLTPSGEVSLNVECAICYS